MEEAGYIRLSGGTSAYLAPALTPARGLVLLPSMFGTTPTFEQMARRLAVDHQWSVCVPEIITEEPNAPFEQRRSAVRDVPDDRVFSILKDAADATGCQSVSLIGFCVGGMYAMKATSLSTFDRLVAFYGMVRVPSYWQSPVQGEPLAYLLGNTDRILAIFGDSDEFIPVTDIEALEAIGVPAVRYPDAGHAFAHGETSDHYRAEDAADAWRRALAFIRELPGTDQSEASPS